MISLICGILKKMIQMYLSNRNRLLDFENTLNGYQSVVAPSQLILFDILDCNVAHQASLFMGFFQARVGCHFPPSGDLPDSGIEPMSTTSPMLQADSLPAEPLGKWLPEGGGVS